MYETISEHVFPWLRTLGGNGSTYSHHMRDARFTIPTPALLANVVTEVWSWIEKENQGFIGFCRRLLARIGVWS